MPFLFRYALFLIFSLVLAACGADDAGPRSDRVTGENIASEVLDATGIEAASSEGVCELLSRELLSARLNIAADTQITHRPSKHSPQPLCTASWEKPNAAEIQEQIGSAMQDYMMAKARGEDVEMPSFRTTDEVSLTLNEPVARSPEQALGQFDSAMQILSEGVTGKRGDIEVTFQADLVPVDGVGDKAMWAEKMRQLSVVSGRRLFHITVNTGAEDRNQELAAAKAIAADLIPSL